MPDAYFNRSLLKRPAFNLADLGEAPSPIPPDVRRPQLPEIEAPPAAGGGPLGSAAYSGLGEVPSAPSSLADTLAASQPDLAAQTERVLNSGLFASPKPQRRSPALQALGYATAFLGGPLRNTDLPSRLIYKQPPVDPAIRQRQIEEASRTGRAEETSYTAASGRGLQRELAAGVTERHEQDVTESQENRNQRSMASKNVRRNILIGSGARRVSQEQLTSNGQPDPSIFDPWTEQIDDDIYAWPKGSGKKLPPRDDYQGAIRERQPDGSWKVVFDPGPEAPKDLDNDLTFQRQMAMYGIRRGDEKFDRAATIWAKKEANMETVENGINNQIKQLDARMYGYGDFPSWDKPDADLSGMFGDLDAGGEHRNEYRRIRRALEQQRAAGKDLAERKAAAALLGVGIKYAPPTYEQELQSPELQRFIRPLSPEEWQQQQSAASASPSAALPPIAPPGGAAASVSAAPAAEGKVITEEQLRQTAQLPKYHGDVEAARRVATASGYTIVP